MSDASDPIEAELEKLDAEEQKPPSSSIRRLLPVLLAVVTLAGFTGVVWYAYSKGVREGSEFAAPILKPDGPSKMAPDSPGGQRIADQDKLVYGKIDKSGESRKVERLLPPPENPLPAPIVRTEPPPLPTPGLDVPNDPPTSEMPAPPEKVSAPPSEADTGTEKPAAGEPAATTDTEESPDKIEPSAGVTITEGRAAPPVPREAVKSPEPKLAVKAPEPKPDDSAANAPAKADPASGYRIQIGSLRSADAARTAWERQVKKHGAILGELTLLVKRVDLDTKGVYYRVQAGPFETKAAASEVCDALKRRDVGCFVVRP